MASLFFWIIAIAGLSLLVCSPLVVANASNSTTAHSLRPTKTTTKAQRLLESPSSVKDLIQAYQIARANLYTKLKQDYGSDNFVRIFMESKNTTVSRGRRYLSSPSGIGHGEGPSRDRMTRKLAIKILKGLIDGQEQSFVWVAGGHSSAAGHGNFYSENYAAVFEDTSRGVFRSVGMSVQGKNYAMGSTGSGLDVSGCLEAIFGTDLDVLSWDYGLLDKKNYNLLERFCYRANRHPTHPACVVYVNSGTYAKGRVEASKKVESAGGTVLFVPPSVQEEAANGFPDTAAVGGQAEIEAMPPLVRSFRCGKMVEKGEPTCATDKFRKIGDKACDHRKYQVSWHPGWKWHALMGNLKALAMVEYIDDALKLIETSGSDPSVLLKQLVDDEQADHNQMLQDPNFNKLYDKAPTLCHTARLPAETRYQGILTESDKKGFDFYYKGMDFKESENYPMTDGQELPLTFDADQRQKSCSKTLNIDFKDTFTIWGSYPGFSTLILPNAAERNAYMEADQTLHGIIAVCFRPCGKGKECLKFCDGIIPCSIGADQVNRNQAHIQVNGINVTHVKGSGCGFLEGPQGNKWKANENGQYVIGFNLPPPGSFMRITTVIIW